MRDVVQDYQEAYRPGQHVMLINMTDSVGRNHQTAVVVRPLGDTGLHIVRLLDETECVVSRDNMAPYKTRPKSFQPADLLVIDGVKSRPELNGTHAICKLHEASKGRWIVILEVDQSEVSLKEEVLFPRYQ